MHSGKKSDSNVADDQEKEPASPKLNPGTLLSQEFQDQDQQLAHDARDGLSSQENEGADFDDRDDEEDKLVDFTEKIQRLSMPFTQKVPGYAQKAEVGSRLRDGRESQDMEAGALFKQGNSRNVFESGAKNQEDDARYNRKTSKTMNVT